MQRLLPLIFLASACTTPDDLSVVEAYVLCHEADCGVNNDYMGGYFSDLRFGDENDQGFTLTSFTNPNWGPLTARLDVFNDRFIPVEANGALMTSEEVVGTVLHLTDKAGVAWELLIRGIHTDARFWALPTPYQIQTYAIGYRKAGTFNPAEHDGYWQFCRNEELPGDDDVMSDALAFEGERYDAETKAIETSSVGGFNQPPAWFNLSCLGSAPAKMFMVRETQASSNDATDLVNIETKFDERRAFLNAWTGNYCGDGVSFTRTGERLQIRDSKNWLIPEWGWKDFATWEKRTFRTYEAAWNKTGAICLDEPRRADSDAGVYEEIQDHCKAVRGHRIPRCTDGNSKLPAWPKTAHILTVNPWDS
jgi:ADYC domain